MAQDYHIYIHDNKGGSGNGGGNQTTPFSAKSNGGAFATKAVSSAEQALSYGTGQSSIGQTGVAALAKAVPWVAAAIAVLKLGDRVLSTGFAHQVEYTGNYKNAVSYNNFKAAIGNVFNPMGFVFKQIKEQAQFNKQNMEIEQQNKLVGKTVFGSFNKTGV